MDGIFCKTESNQQRFDTQNLFESADDRNRTARVERERFFAECLYDGLFGCTIGRHIGRCDIGVIDFNRYSQSWINVCTYLVIPIFSGAINRQMGKPF